MSCYSCNIKKDPFFYLSADNKYKGAGIVLSGVCICHMLDDQLWLILNLLWQNAKTFHMRGILSLRVLLSYSHFQVKKLSP